MFFKELSRLKGFKKNASKFIYFIRWNPKLIDKRIVEKLGIGKIFSTIVAVNILNNRSLQYGITKSL